MAEPLPTLHSEICFLVPHSSAAMAFLWQTYGTAVGINNFEGEELITDSDIDYAYGYGPNGNRTTGLRYIQDKVQGQDVLALYPLQDEHLDNQSCGTPFSELILLPGRLVEVKAGNEHYRTDRQPDIRVLIGYTNEAGDYKVANRSLVRKDGSARLLRHESDTLPVPETRLSLRGHTL
jgi:hypothetical protein